MKCEFCAHDGNDTPAETGFLVWQLCWNCYHDALLQIAGGLENRKSAQERSDIMRKVK